MHSIKFENEWKSETFLTHFYYKKVKNTAQAKEKIYHVYREDV